MIHVMWREERLWNVGVLQTVQLSNLFLGHRSDTKLHTLLFIPPLKLVAAAGL
jgi:hypothetical protein